MTSSSLPGRGRTALAALALLALSQCSRPESSGGARVVVEAGAAPPAGSDREAQHPPTDGSTDAIAAPDAESPTPSLGDWLEGNIYRLRLEAVRRCAPDAAGSTRVGVLVRVTSKMDELLIAPRDFKLEAGGVVLDSAVLGKPPAGCAPLLAPKSLRAGKATAGIVVFDVPVGFAAEPSAVRMTYQPTRWGGARRVEAALPPGALAR
jgi:hypothetical protein